MIARAHKLTPLDAYVSAVILAGAVCAASLVHDGVGDLHRLISPEALMLVVFAFAGQFVPLKVFTRGAEGEVTASTAFALASMFVVGPLAGLVTLGLANIAADVLDRKAFQKVAFNFGQYAITVWATGLVLRVTTGLPRADVPHLAPGDLAGVLLAAATFFLVNVALVSTVVALATSVSVFSYMLRDFVFQASINGLMLGLAPIIVLAADFALPAVVLLFLPIVAVHRGGREAIAKEHQSLHDALTGLPNRELFKDRIDQTVRQGRRTGDIAVVMIMDLDHFKEINDTLGHHMGDLLLQEVSSRLRATLRASDPVARLGGDEFGVLLPSVHHPEDAAAVAQQLLTQLREPFVL